jgi:hypothetical protein
LLKLPGFEPMHYKRHTCWIRHINMIKGSFGITVFYKFLLVNYWTWVMTRFNPLSEVGLYGFMFKKFKKKSYFKFCFWPVDNKTYF